MFKCLKSNCFKQEFNTFLPTSNEQNINNNNTDEIRRKRIYNLLFIYFLRSEWKNMALKKIKEKKIFELCNS